MTSRNSWLYMGGTLVSTFGDKVLFIAAAIWVRTLTGSNADAGLTFFFYIAPAVVVGPVAGLIADRLPRRWVLITTDAMAAIVLLGLLGVHGPSTLWLIYLVIAVYGGLATIGSAAGVGLRTTVFRDEQLASANGLISTVSEGMRLFVPLVGAGLFVAAGAMAVVSVDIGSFLIAIVLLVGLRVVEEHEVTNGVHWVAQMMGGVRHIIASPVLGCLTLAVVILLATFGFLETAIFALVTDGLNRSAPFIGVLMAAQGIGAIAAGLTSAMAIRRLGELRVVSGGMLMIALSSTVLLLGAYPDSILALLVVLLGAVLIGASVTWLLVAANTAIQLSTPHRLMGRVDAALNVVLSGVQSISIALGAGLVGLLGFRIPIALVIASALMGMIILLYKTPSLTPES